MLYKLKMTLSGSESLPGHCPWTPSRWRCASLASLTPLAIIIHNYFPPLRLGWLQPCIQLNIIVHKLHFAWITTSSKPDTYWSAVYCNSSNGQQSSLWVQVLMWDLTTGCIVMVTWQLRPRSHSGLWLVGWGWHHTPQTLPSGMHISARPAEGRENQELA